MKNENNTLTAQQRSPIEPREGIRWKMKPDLPPLRNEVLTEPDGHPVTLARAETPLIEGKTKPDRDAELLDDLREEGEDCFGSDWQDAQDEGAE